MRKVASFDFDGTLTTRDTLFEFIRFVKGTPRTLFGILLFAPLMVIAILGLYDRGRCKERLLSHFFRGMRYDDFKRLGECFAAKYQEFMRPETNARLKEHLSHGDTIYIISASVREWVRPIGMSLGVADVLCTEMEIDERGLLTGRFSTPNCSGPEKVRRLLEREPDRSSYHLCAYGDSGGDREMLSFADHSTKIQ
ncbi:MAG: haloacid dehalogenase-like hydrolase [Prevotella sp.]|nr:haloacid dehalogenase-like hydrolase [Prevotella sp.]